MMPVPAGPGPVPVAASRYTLRERIAGGAAGSVYAADDSVRQCTVAVKVIAADLEHDPEARERFFREAHIMARLAHPNIVRIFDAGEDHGHPFIAMELIEGLSLGEYLRTHADLPVATRVDLIIQLYSGLEAAHAAGAVHRDIKPANIIVQPDGRLKILDFGLARLQHSTLTANGAVVGSPGYMSPEQAEGKRVDERSDIFSAAAVAYLILTGRPPFSRRNLPLSLQAILHDPPEALTTGEAPAPLASVLMKALEKAPEARYQTCAEVLAALGRVHSMLVPS
ncbi:MAG: serine/threonine-protein kinase [Vicinamibacterales bacterium]